MMTVGGWSELVLSMTEAGRINQTSLALLLTPKEAERYGYYFLSSHSSSKTQVSVELCMAP